MSVRPQDANLIYEARPPHGRAAGLTQPKNRDNEMRFAVETITPVMARDILQMNHSNRPLRARRVERYANLMAAGEWMLTGEPIIMNGTKLLNGQHRLHACVEAATSFTTLVVYDVPAEVMKVLDSGMPRSMADVLAADGVTQSNTLAAAARAVLGWRFGIVHNSAKMGTTVTRVMIADLVEHDPSWATALTRSLPVYRSLSMSKAVWCALAYEIGQKADPDTLDEFLARLADGVGLAEDSPILALRTWCINSVTLRRRRATHEILIAAVKAWNAYVLGTPLRKIQLTSGDYTIPPIRS